MMRRYNAPRRRVFAIAFVTVTIFFVATLRTLYLSDGRFRYVLPFGLGFGHICPDRPNLHEAPTCAPKIDHLRRNNYGLTGEILYQRRCIKPLVDNNVDRSSIATVAGPLVGEAQAIHLDKNCQGWIEPRCDPVTLDVHPAYPKRDYSDILFGVATSFDRLRDAMSQFEGWLSNTGARMLAVVTDADGHSADLNKLAVEFRDHGMELIPIRPWNTMLGANEQHFTIIRDLLWHATPKTKWVAIIDDDTLFPSLYPLAKALDKHDHTAEAYLGGLSENQHAVNFHGYMAYGGAGVFLSMPLVRRIEPLIEQCLEEEHVPQGDGLLKYCVYNKTSTRFAQIPGLHQMDMGGDMSGFYESGKLPVSLHHWKTWHHAPVDKMSQVSEFCGDCFLQRWKFGSDTVFSNGYSVTVYADGTDSIDLKRMEGTWDGAEGFEWSMGPMRESVPKSRKKSYRLVESEKVGKNLRQIYVHRPEDDLPDTETEEFGWSWPDMRDEVLELWWEW